MTVENPAAPTEATEAKPHGVELTDAAAGKAKALLDQEGRNDMSLRIAVQPGGCAGLRYQLFFDDRSLDGDLERDYNGLTVSSFEAVDLDVVRARDGLTFNVIGVTNTVKD